jgi:hypothetical protein
MSRRRLDRAWIAAPAVTLALALAGCGGDDETTAETTAATGATGPVTELTQEEFVSQANAICADVNTELAALSQPQDLQALADYAAEGLAIVEPALEQFQAITPPADLQAQWAEYLAAAEEQVELTRQLQAAAEAGDQQEATALLNQLRELDNEDRARELGLDECADDTSPEG